MLLNAPFLLRFPHSSLHCMLHPRRITCSQQSDFLHQSHQAVSCIKSHLFLWVPSLICPSSWIYSNDRLCKQNGNIFTLFVHDLHPLYCLTFLDHYHPAPTHTPNPSWISQYSLHILMAVIRYSHLSMLNEIRSSLSYSSELLSINQQYLLISCYF